MADVDFPAIKVELAQLRERAKAACEDPRRLTYERRATMEDIHARMRRVRAAKEEFREFLRQVRSGAG